MPSPAEAGGVLAVAGDLVEDIVVWAAEPLRAATDTSARVFRARGGSGANVAALAAPLVATRGRRGRACQSASGSAADDDALDEVAREARARPPASPARARAISGPDADGTAPFEVHLEAAPARRALHVVEQGGRRVVSCPETPAADAT